MPIQILATVRATFTPSALGISTVYRTTKPAAFYAGRAIWGVGRYFSLSKQDCERIDDGGVIEAFRLPDSLRLMAFDLTWRFNSEQSDADYRELHELIKHPPPSSVDGYAVQSHSMQYGYNQVVIFPHAQSKIQPL